MIVPGAAPGRSASKIAWWKLWSKRSPFGSMRFSPWRSKVAKSSRSVAATPSRRLFVRGSVTSASGKLSSARRRLSTGDRRSRAKLLIAYFSVSSRSRWARRLTFSVSASARSSRSFASASSCSSASTRSSGETVAAPSSGNSPTAASPTSLAGARAAWSLSSFMPSSDEPPDHLRGVIHHRDDPGIVDPRRADDPDRADDLLAAVLVRRDDDRTAGDAEEMAVGADKNLHPVGPLAGVEQAQHGFLGLQHLEQGAQPLEIGERGDVLEQIGLAAHDQRALSVTTGPARQPGRDHPRCQLVELRLMRADLILDIRPRLLDRAADEPSIEVITGADQGCRRQTERHLDYPVLDEAVLGDQHDKRAARPEMHELDVLQWPFRLWHDDDPGTVRQAGERRGRLFQRLREALAPRRAEALEVVPLGLREIADLQEAVHEQAQPRLCGQPPGRGVRRIEEPRLFEIRHDVAVRRRRQVLAQQP